MSDREQTYPPEDNGGLPPLAIVAAVLVAGAAVFFVTRRNSSSGDQAVNTARDAAQRVSRQGGSATRRAALSMLINAIESDATRRFVLMALKFARDRL